MTVRLLFPSHAQPTAFKLLAAGAAADRNVMPPKFLQRSMLIRTSTTRSMDENSLSRDHLAHGASQTSTVKNSSIHHFDCSTGSLSEGQSAPCENTN